MEEHIILSGKIRRSTESGRMGKGGAETASAGER